MLVLPPLYHWSPNERIRSITRLGLVPGKKSSCISGLPEEGELDDLDIAVRNWRAPYVCLGSSPKGAWSLSGDVFGKKGTKWDLWEVKLDRGDEVHIRPDFGPVVLEVRVHNRIPKRRVWWVADREL